METENIKTTSGRKTGFYIVAAILAVFVIYYTVMSLLSPAAKISAANKEFGYQQPEKGAILTDIRILTDSAFAGMNRGKAFYTARITMAETDSLCLALNLADSLATLEIDGVAVHRAKIIRMKISKFFIKADEYAITSILSAPLTVIKDYATIKKEPLMIKMAPKDTSEYKPDIIPDTTNSAAVNYILEMQNGIRLYVYQQEEVRSKGGFNRFLFDLNDRFRNIWDTLKSIMVLKVPEYHPYVKIRMSKADAKIIYRALPRHGQISIYR
jgi:hypothetical protein